MPEIDQRATIAVHESGHAVLSRVLRLPSGKAVIDGSPFAYVQDDNGIASLLTALAGSAAEVELLGLATDGGVVGDRPKVLRLLDALHVDSDTCWLIARQLCRLHRNTIAAVAAALLQHGELSADALDQLVVERESE